jgi:flavin-binding protein dodecin
VTPLGDREPRSGDDVYGRRCRGRRSGTDTKELHVADIAKVITVIGSSPDGFAEAAQVAVSEASKTLRGISGADVVSMSAEVDGDRITTYRTTVNIAFAIERDS